MAVDHSNKRVRSERRTYTRFPLIVTKSVMRIIAVRVSDDLRSWNELDRWLEMHVLDVIGCGRERRSG